METSALGTLSRQSSSTHHPEHTCNDRRLFRKTFISVIFCVKQTAYLDNPKSVTLMVPLESTKQFLAAYKQTQSISISFFCKLLNHNHIFVVSHTRSL